MVRNYQNDDYRSFENKFILSFIIIFGTRTFPISPLSVRICVEPTAQMHYSHEAARRVGVIWGPGFPSPGKGGILGAPSCDAVFRQYSLPTCLLELL